MVVGGATVAFEAKTFVAEEANLQWTDDTINVYSRTNTCGCNC